MRKKSKSTNDMAQPTSKQEKEVLMGSAQVSTSSRPNFTRNDRSKIEICIYLYYKELSHIKKVGTEYEA
jgi:hypothetical protein